MDNRGLLIFLDINNEKVGFQGEIGSYSEEAVHRSERAYSFKDCLFNLTAEGDVLMNYLRLPMSNPILQKVGFLFCVERGVDIGGNPEARKKSLTFAKNFMKRVLLTP